MGEEQEQKFHQLTEEPVSRVISHLAVPCIISMLVTAFYNMADTFFVGMLRSNAATGAVGVVFSMMAVIQAVGFFFGHGSGNFISRELGRRNTDSASNMAATGFFSALFTGLLICVFGEIFLTPLAAFLGSSPTILPYAKDYLRVILIGAPWMTASLVLNNQLRFQGNAIYGTIGIASGAVLNIGLDLLFVLVFRWGIAGAAAATVFAQYVSGLGLWVYTRLRCRELLPGRAELRFDRAILREILDMSLLTCAQQSAMNFGILLIQRLVDSFGPITMAAFAAAVKIDTFAYLPVQDFGNAFSTFIAQNYGAGQHDRLRRGFRQAVLVSAAFSAAISLLVCVFAAPLMRIFVQVGETEVLAAGVRYLRIEGACYVGIGCLFLLYGFYRAVKRPGMSVVLTVISLGVRVLLAYLLAGPVGEVGIWLAIPIGWALADLTGFAYYARHRAALLPPAPTAAVINLK